MFTTSSRKPGSTLSPDVLWWCLLHGKRPWWTSRQARRFLPGFFPLGSDPEIQANLRHLIESDRVTRFGRHRFAPRTDRELTAPVFHDPWGQPWADLYDHLGYPIAQPTWPLAKHSAILPAVTGRLRPWPMQKRWHTWIRTRFRFYRLITETFPLPPYTWTIITDASKNEPVWGWSFGTGIQVKEEYRCSPSDRPEDRAAVFLGGFGHWLEYLASNALPPPNAPLPNEKLKRVDEAAAVYTGGYHLQPWAVTLTSTGPDTPTIGIHLAWPMTTNPEYRPSLPASLRSKSPGPVHWPGVSFWFRRASNGWSLHHLTWGDIHVRRWLRPDDLMRRMDDLCVPSIQNDTMPFPHPQALLNTAARHDASHSINACFHRLNQLLLTKTPFHRFYIFPTAETLLEYLIARGRHHGRFVLDSFFGPSTGWPSITGAFTQHQPWIWFMGPRLATSPASTESMAALWNPLLNPVDRFAILTLFQGSNPTNIDEASLTHIDRIFHSFLAHLMTQFLTWGTNDPYPNDTFTILTARVNGMLIFHPERKGYGWIPAEYLLKNGWFFRPALFQWIHRQTHRSLSCGDTLTVMPLIDTLPFHLPAFAPASVEKNK